jgi:hypothetical protein
VRTSLSQIVRTSICSTYVDKEKIGIHGASCHDMITPISHKRKRGHEKQPVGASSETKQLICRVMSCEMRNIEHLVCSPEIRAVLGRQGSCLLKRAVARQRISLGPCRAHHRLVAKSRHGTSPVTRAVPSRRAVPGRRAVPANVPNQKTVQNPSKFYFFLQNFTICN